MSGCVVLTNPHILKVPYIAGAFVWEIDTTKAGSASDTMVMPAVNWGTYNGTIDWGDGTTSAITAHNDADLTHVYDEPGVYIVQMTGTFPSPCFNNGGDKLKILSVKQWGNVNISLWRHMFYGCSNFKYEAIDTVTPTGTCENFFRACTSLNQDISGFRTDNITTMDTMFAGCSNFNQSISHFNTANATSMFSMFSSCTVFNQPVSHFNTAKVGSFRSMFFNCLAFNQSVANFTFKAGVSIESMFQGCVAFNQSVAAWDTTNIVNMALAFYETAMKQSFANFNLSGLGATSRLTLFAALTNINEAGTSTNYDNTLIAWAAQLPLTYSQSTSFGTAKYGAGAGKTARDALTAAGWSITDGGQL